VIPVSRNNQGKRAITGRVAQPIIARFMQSCATHPKMRENAGSYYWGEVVSRTASVLRGGSSCFPFRTSVSVICALIYVPCGSENLIADGAPQSFWQEVLLGKISPSGDGAISDFCDDAPQGTRRQASGIGESAHLLGGDSPQAAAAAKGERKGVVRDVGIVATKS